MKHPYWQSNPQLREVGRFFLRLHLRNAPWWQRPFILARCMYVKYSAMWRLILMYRKHWLTVRVEDGRVVRRAHKRW